MFKRSPCARSRPSLAVWLTIAFAIIIACASGAKAATPCTAELNIDRIAASRPFIMHDLPQAFAKALDAALQK